MNDMNELMRNVFRSALLVMAICLLIWALLPTYKPVAAGFLLGTMFSLINARLLRYKIESVTRVALANSGKRVNSGYLARASVVLIGTMVAIKYPQFHLTATIVGFFYTQAAMLVIGFWLATQKKHDMKRGDI